MSDISCRLCGEFWNAYGAKHGDMEPHEYQRFIKGQGCPSCGFGTTCPSCNGSQVQSDDVHCDECLDRGYLIVRRRVGSGDLWAYGYYPNVRLIDVQTFAFVEYAESRDGMYEYHRAMCPHCAEDRTPCRACNGTGQLVAPESEEGLLQKFLWSAAESTDEDPISFLLGDIE